MRACVRVHACVLSLCVDVDVCFKVRAMWMGSSVLLQSCFCVVCLITNHIRSHIVGTHLSWRQKKLKSPQGQSIVKYSDFLEFENMAGWCLAEGWGEALSQTYIAVCVKQAICYFLLLFLARSRCWWWLSLDTSFASCLEDKGFQYTLRLRGRLRAAAGFYRKLMRHIGASRLALWVGEKDKS